MKGENMPTITWFALEQFDKNTPEAKTAGQRLLDALPVGARFQVEAYWQEIEKVCQHRAEVEVTRRPVNGLNIEHIGGAARCLLQSPDHLGLRYLLSGGPVTAYGRCCLSGCPLGTDRMPERESHP
jgi:hypothetical protein